MSRGGSCGEGVGVSGGGEGGERAEGSYIMTKLKRPDAQVCINFELAGLALHSTLCCRI